jgi:chemotaxis protein methyltransferase CheR
VALTQDIVAAVAQRLAAHAGLELPAWVVEARATARIALLACSPSEYVALLDSARGDRERSELIEAVRVGESRLFRHRSQIEVLTGIVAPALRARGQRAVRVWSAGCAAGEEPYTLAIVLSRALPGCAISILATDVSAGALAQALTATYPRAALQHVPAPYRDRFQIDGDGIRVAPQIAALVQFERANLLDGATPRGCDVVWCRNVLIYFTADARRRVVDRLVDATVPGGFVFVGYSESLRDVPELEGMRANDAVYYVRRGAGTAPRARPPTLPVPVPASDRPSAPIVISGHRAPQVPERVAPDPPVDSAIDLRGRPVAARVTAELSARLAQPGLRSLTIGLDGADLLADDLAPVLRRARAAARTAGIALVVRATRAGARRWLARHGLEEHGPEEHGLEGHGPEEGDAT